MSKFDILNVPIPIHSIMYGGNEPLLKGPEYIFNDVFSFISISNSVSSVILQYLRKIFQIRLSIKYPSLNTYFDDSHIGQLLFFPIRLILYTSTERRSIFLYINSPICIKLVVEECVRFYKLILYYNLV